MMEALAVDLGNTTVAAATLGAPGEVPELIELGYGVTRAPARVHVSSAGIVFGEEAVTRADRNVPGMLSTLMWKLQAAPRSGTLRGPDVTEFVGRYFQSIVERATASAGTAPQRLLVLRPQGWTDDQAGLLADIAGTAGVDDVQLIGDGEAVAAQYRRRLPKLGSPVVAFDFGGTTVKATVVGEDGRHVVVGQAQTLERLGGADVDEVVFEHCVETLVRDAVIDSPNALANDRMFREQCVRAKEELSSAPSASVHVEIGGRTHGIEISRSDFEARVAPTLEIAVDAARRVIENAGLEPDDIAHIVLAGGSSRIPLVGDMLRSSLGRPVELVDDPADAAVLGAIVLTGIPVAIAELDITPQTLPPARAQQIETVTNAGAMGASTAARGAAPPNILDQERAEATTTAVASPDEDAAASVESDSRLPLGALIAAGVVLAAVVGLAAILLANSRDEFEQARTEGVSVETAPDETGVGSERGDGADDGNEANSASTGRTLPSGLGMLAVEGGAFVLGSDDGSLSGVPKARAVNLDTFFLDEREVTNRDFRPFFEATGLAPDVWPAGQIPDGMADHPVTGVSWAWADGYCNALGKRLPTEAEWEAAARSVDGRRYPWGDDPDAVDLPAEGTYEVASVVENRSPSGVYDLYGNAWEWVSDPYEPVEDPLVVLRGGGVGQMRNGVLDRQTAEPANLLAISVAGFRCAADEVGSTASGALDRAILSDLQATMEASTSRAEVELSDAFIDDHFDDGTTGWDERDETLESGTALNFGYELPSYYRLQLNGPKARGLALRGVDYGDAEIQAQLRTDLHSGGDYRTGLVFRAHPTDPAEGGDAEARLENYYAFVVQPGTDGWQWIHNDSVGLRVLASGPLPDELPDGAWSEWISLTVRATGNELELLINETLVATEQMSSLHPIGDIGFLVETIDDDTSLRVFADRITAAPR